MRRPECGANRKQSEGLQCRMCRYAFAIDAETYPGWTDGRFLETVQAASGKGEHYFTVNQLYTAYS